MDRRRYPRARIAVDTEIVQPGRPVCYGVAKDVSLNGVFVHQWGGHAPALGDEVVIHFKIWTGREKISRQLRARVSRLTKAGVALEFTDHDVVAEAVVHDLVYYMRFERREAPRPPPHLLLDDGAVPPLTSWSDVDDEAADEADVAAAPPSRVTRH